MHEIVYSVLPGELVFDIGAHTGDKTEWFAERGIRVVAVEPQPIIAEALRKRFEDNTDVIVLQKGVANVTGQMLMQINLASPTLSTFSEKWKIGRFKETAWGDNISVEMTTIDQLVIEYGQPRYVKVDVEGSEKSVMLGLSRKVGIISLEFTTEFLKDITDLLWYSRGLGYSYYNYSLAEQNTLELKRWLSIDEVAQELSGVCCKDPLPGAMSICVRNSI